MSRSREVQVAGQNPVVQERPPFIPPAEGTGTREVLRCGDVSKRGQMALAWIEGGRTLSMRKEGTCRDVAMTM